MAGRGRGATIPAWMLQGGAGGEEGAAGGGGGAAPPAAVPGAYSAPAGSAAAGGGGRARSRSQERPGKDDGRGRAAPAGGGGGGGGGGGVYSSQPYGASGMPAYGQPAMPFAGGMPPQMFGQQQPLLGMPGGYPQMMLQNSQFMPGMPLLQQQPQLQQQAQQQQPGQAGASGLNMLDLMAKVKQRMQAQGAGAGGAGGGGGGGLAGGGMGLLGGGGGMLGMGGGGLLPNLGQQQLGLLGGGLLLPGGLLGGGGGLGGLASASSAGLSSGSSSGGYGGFAGSAPAAPPTNSATRPFRRLYIGSLPPGTTAAALHRFLNDTIQRAGHGPGPHVVEGACGEVGDKAFAFVEFHSMEMCAAVVALNGILFNGRALKITRPRDWKAEHQPPLGTPIVLSPGDLGVLSRVVAEGPNKVFIGGIPTSFNEEALKEMLSVFGKLKAMNLVRDPGAPLNKGFAFFEFEDTANTAPAVAKLNGYQLEVGKPPLTVRIATPLGQTPPPPAFVPGVMMPGGGGGAGGVGMAGGAAMHSSAAVAAAAATAAAAAMGANPHLMPYGYVPAPAPPTNRVLKLSNMVTLEELGDDVEYGEIRADVEEELKRQGTLLSLLIPRTGTLAGYIFAEFATPANAAAVAGVLSTKVFGGKQVVVTMETDEGYAAIKEANPT